MFGPLCVSVAEVETDLTAKQLRGLGFAELRLDAFDPFPVHLEQLVSLPEHCLLTCRPGRLSAGEQRNRLLLGLASQPDLLDVDLDAPEDVRLPVLEQLAESACGLVLSQHWYQDTPKRKILEETVGTMLQTRAKVVKIAAYCQSTEDMARLMGLYHCFNRERSRLVVLGMGPLAALSRLVILQLGAPFTFVAPDTGSLTAPGQLRFSLACQILEQAGLG